MLSFFWLFLTKLLFELLPFVVVDFCWKNDCPFFRFLYMYNFPWFFVSFFFLLLCLWKFLDIWILDKLNVRNVNPTSQCPSHLFVCVFFPMSPKSLFPSGKNRQMILFPFYPFRCPLDCYPSFCWRVLSQHFVAGKKSVNAIDNIIITEFR